ncbi:uncharacterized protein GGS22DRAFT_111436 [Annulohypoxylon maeteangense]|uniref:uncharacterized protein n=1 Tax=Annulohypoxylon maeteangense TaxID=1927788 RepID=UPI002008C6D3|nr:uncharacterized protein GGS22DRAFT_111436 [Annulohypoxylon maeteangense]KAI0887571.1 hypothetical protein GGS22DRAFT_111436 [Annulohypoxylon maeteangense]
MSKYEALRLENIKRNEALVKDLGLQNDSLTNEDERKSAGRKPPAAKRRKLHPTSQPTRTSARIANSSTQPIYNEDAQNETSVSKRKPRKNQTSNDQSSIPRSPSPQPPPSKDLKTLIASWSSWKPEAPPPTRDVEGTYHFPSHPQFTPNKSPEAIIQEGSFGGTYWRPLYSRHLRTTISEDWRELPTSWTSGLDVQKYLSNKTYNPEINKYGVSCGQSIEEWEAAGWIAHEYDVRGWFQWYCRFWLGRRCADDERQISRWRKCVGETGRWRRTLLRKYVQMGIRSVMDEGDDGDEERAGDVSPVVHQTCHHWGWEVRQQALDRFWVEGK